MFVAAVVVSSLLAALLGFAAIRKFSHREDVVEGYARSGCRRASSTTSRSFSSLARRD